MSRRLTELLRFAVVLTGDDARARALVVELVRHASVRWNSVLSLGRPFSVLRGGVARAYVADDASAGVARPSDEFADLTPTQRAVLVLSAFAGQTTDEIAATLELTPDEVAAAHRDGMVTLGLDGEAESVALLTELLDGLADEVEPDTDEARELIGTPSENDDETSAESFAALFGVPGHDVQPAEERPTSAPQYVMDAPTTSPAAPDELPETVPAPDVPARAPGRGVRAATVAGIVVVAVLVSALIAHTSRTPEAAPTSSSVPTSTPSPVATVTPSSISAPIKSVLPGARLLGEFFGSGSRAVSGAVYSTSAKRQLVINAICSGGGSATIGPVTLSSCNGTPGSAVVRGGSLRSVAVRAAASTTWRFVVVDSPPQDTNGELQYPASSLLTGGSVATRVARSSGTGPATVPLAAGTTSSRVETLRLVLTCTGTGLTFSTADGSLTGARVGSCYDGWSYAFTIPHAVLPGTLRVTAPETATWRLVVVRG